jgi:CheY-like chemotaxis protein
MTLQDKRVFIVEDNIHNRVVFTMALKLRGAQLEFDRWGRDTLSRIKSLPGVDLIILDLMLPGTVTGYDIFEMLRKVPTYASVPIVAVSASEPSVAIPKARDQGFSGFIAKPIDGDLFPVQLERILAGEQVWYAGGRYQGMNI